MIKIHGKRHYKYYDNFTDKLIEKEWEDTIDLSNGVKIKLENKIRSYIELQDRIMINVYNLSIEYYERMFNLYQGKKYHDRKYLEPQTSEVNHRNIFCYSKEDGKLLWQVESKEDSPYVEVNLNIPDCETRKVNHEVIYKDEAGIALEDRQVFGVILKESFRKGKDSLVGHTFSCHGYNIDIDTGKVTFVYQGK